MPSLWRMLLSEWQYFSKSWHAVYDLKMAWDVGSDSIWVPVSTYHLNHPAPSVFHLISFSSLSFNPADENIALLCKKENIKFGSCLVNCLQCYYRKDCGWEYMLMKLICSGKQISSLHECKVFKCVEMLDFHSLQTSRQVINYSRRNDITQDSHRLVTLMPVLWGINKQTEL